MSYLIPIISTHACAVRLFSLYRHVGSFKVNLLCSLCCFDLKLKALFRIYIKIHIIKMSWSTENIIHLIEGYEANPCLFNEEHKDYHNKQKRNVALKHLSEILPKPILDIQKKWNGIRNTYSAERRKVLESQKSGAGVNEIYVPKLWYNHKLQFLNEFLTIRKAVSSFDINETASTSNDLDMMYEVGDDGVLSPLSNEVPDEVYETPHKKKKKVEPSLTDKASDALDSIARAISSASNDDENSIYGKYVTERLTKIKNKKRLLQVKQKIDNLLYEAQLEELD